jgi:hypothetical protein
MAAQNQGNTNKVYGSFGYDNPSYITRNSAILAANAAGSGTLTGKFYAHAALTLWGVTFNTLTAGTSTYTVNGTATSPATSLYAIYITNTATNSVALATTTIGAAALGFVVGGTSTAGANVNVLGVGGGVAGGFQGPYSLNTLGGTNTSFVWGSSTFVIGSATGAQISVGPPGGGNAGLGGLPMNPGDVLYFVNGTDASATVIPVVHFSLGFNAQLPI